jgi:hypothetical protein
MEDRYHLIVFSTDGTKPYLLNEVTHEEALRVAHFHTVLPDRRRWVGWTHVSYFPASQLLKQRRIPLDGRSH